MKKTAKLCQHNHGKPASGCTEFLQKILLMQLGEKKYCGDE
jgi:hypothetical protein